MKLKNVILWLKSKLSNIYGKNKKMFVFSLVLIVVLLIYFLYLPNGGDKDNKTAESSQQDALNTKTYADEIEIKIERMLMSISEVTKAEVMVVCESTEVYEYLKNLDETKAENGNVTSREEVVYEKNGSNSKPIIITTKAPKVVGVWVIVNSVSSSTKLAITNSIKTVLNIDEACINILQER